MGYSALLPASGGAGLPTDDIVITAGASETYDFDRGLAISDGLVTFSISIGNFGGDGTQAYFLDTGGGADADVMSARLLGCISASITSAGAGLTAVVGPESNMVRIISGSTGLLFSSQNSGITVN